MTAQLGDLPSGRSAGSAPWRKLDPAHRRDGLGVALPLLCVVSAGAAWFGLGGSIGRWLIAVFGFAIGLGVLVFPVVLAGVAIALVVTSPRQESRPRCAVGSALLALGTLGLLHLAAGAPDGPAGWLDAVRGYLAAVALAHALPAWLAVVILLLLVGYALLVLTATPIAEVVPRVRRLLGHSPD